MIKLKPKLKIKAKTVIPLAIDSGAYSFYMKHGAPRDETGARIRGKGYLDLVDHSFSSKPEFYKYLDNYVSFIAEYGDQFEYCVALDVIFHPEQSFELYQQMTKAGIKVMPVYHYGEDEKWLKKYLDATDYIGLGGLVKTADKSSGFSFRERTWKLLCDARGKPKVKVHAFGMTSFEPMLRHPYYSVDSTTSFTWSRYGCIMLPNKMAKVGGFDFAKVPLIYPVSPGRSLAKKHIDHHHPDGLIREALQEYADMMQVDMAAMRSEYGARDTANLFFMNRMMEALSAKHSEKVGEELNMIYYASGNFSTTLEKFNESLDHLTKLNATSHLAYLGTYAQLNPLQRVLSDWRGIKIPSKHTKGILV